MMRFIGQYTNGHTTISYLGCTFEGHEPREVSAEVAALLANNPEFETIHPLDHDGDGEPGGSLPDAVKPRKRGRPRKAD